MRILLDTHIVLWWLADHRRLTAANRALIADPGNRPTVSAITVAETGIKASLGKLEAPKLTEEVLAESGFELLAFSAAHAAELRDLPWHHRDPFDRMLIAQARAEGIPLLSADPWIASYEVSRVQSSET